MFRKNGSAMETLKFIGVTGGLALVGLVGQKALTNLLVSQVLNRILGAAAPAASPAAPPATVPASGLGALAVDQQYQRIGGSLIVSVLGCVLTAKVVKDQAARNTIMTGIALGFVHTVAGAVIAKFAPQYAGVLSGDGTAARLSAMYGLGSGASIMPRYAPIGMGEYFQSTNGLGEYFQSTNGLGEYFSSGTNGLGLPSYEAAAGYGANPDLMEAAAGMGASMTSNTNHIDPHGDIDRELTIAEAAAGVGAIPSYEAAAGFGAVSTLPSTSTWIPGSSNPQIWAGTRAVSSPQSSTEMVPAGILQTDGGQGVFG
jgi:hypothetical protein